MIDGLSELIEFNVKGKIGLGCKAVRTECYICDDTGEKRVTALKTGNDFRCTVCNNICVPSRGDKEFTQATPYFVVPDHMKPILGDKPTTLRVIPARKEIERAFPTSYSKFVSSGQIFCTGNGKEADRYDTNTKSKVKVPCNPETCPDSLNKSCKPSGTFYFVLPEVDVFSAYKIVPHSKQSIDNIMSELNKLRMSSNSNIIACPVCTLELVKKKKADGSVYYILQMFLPAVPMSALKSGQGVGVLPYSMFSGEKGNGKKQIEASNDVGLSPEGTVQKAIELPADEKSRIEKGRERVKEKIKIYVKGQFVERALEIYACEKYGVGAFEALSLANLLEIWHGINEKSEIADKVWNLAGKLRHGVGEELPLQRTA